MVFIIVIEFVATISAEASTLKENGFSFLLAPTALEWLTCALSPRLHLFWLVCGVKQVL
jgi:hypothetical protein